MELDLEALVGRQESSASLIRFEDATDDNTPRLNYSVPLPGAFQGKFYVDTDFFNASIPWTSAVREDRRKTKAINNFAAALAAGSRPTVPPIDDLAVLPRGDSIREGIPRPAMTVAGNFKLSEAVSSGGAGPPDSLVAETRPPAPSDMTISDLAISFGGQTVSLDDLADKARAGYAPVFYRTFGGNIKLDFVAEAGDSAEANPRFVIIEHYRVTSHFGDYGAGRTIAVFSLMPGEETTLYIRNWRRTETTTKQASSIFDSYSEESADEFELDLQSETSNTDTLSSAREYHSHYAGSGEINIGIAKTKHSGSLDIDKSSASTKETVAKSAAKTATKHASKASANREIEVTQELEASVETETETIIERKVKNTNLSRTLNIVTRELNQEFTTYVSLIDITLAFANDFGVFEVFQLHEIDDMIERYIEEQQTGGLVDPNNPFGALTARSFVKSRLIDQINTVYDFQGTRHDFLEQVSVGGDEEQVFRPGTAPSNIETYLRVRRNRTGDDSSPFYEPGVVPVDGVVLNEDTLVVRTPAHIIEGLMGHAVTLDNYALGLQQETLREKQLENRKVEVALSLIENPSEAGLEAYRQLFGSVDQELLREVALHHHD